MLIPIFDHEIPELTAEIAYGAFPKGNVVMKIRDALGPIFEDEHFSEMYPTIGQPAASPTRLALVTILQFMEDLTDREAADAVRSRIDWKYLLGLELNDPGFHYSVLSEFRLRLLENEAEQMLLEKILEGCQAAGLLKGKKKQRTDSTHVLANIRVLNRIELVGETMRRVLDDIAQVAPDWLKPLIQPEWGKRYGRKVDTHRIRKSETKKLEMAQAIGEDGRALLTAIYQEETPVEVRQLPSVEVLRFVWVQQYYQTDNEIQWRTKKQQGFPPSRKMVASPDELEARYGSKDGMTWTGYKIHITETCDEDSPRLITHIETTVATTTDGSVTEKIQDDLIEQGLSPESHWVDGGYADVDILLNSQKKGIDLIGPMHQDTSWQTKVEGGYNQTKFSIDWDNMTATCPEGQTSIHWKDGLEWCCLTAD
jgi:transposase